MRHVLSLLIAALALVLNFSSLVAQRVKAPRVPKQSARHMLWRVQSDSTVVYVMGSVHMLPKKFYPLDTILERALDSSDVLVLEVKLDEATQMNVMQKMLTDAMLPPGQTLRELIAPKTYALAQTRLKKNGLDISLFDGMQPWVLALMLSGVELRNSGFTGDLGVDMHLSARAEEQSKPLVGLETVDDQLSVFKSMSHKAQEELLRQAVTDGGSASAALVKLATAWRNGDVKQLEKLALNELKKDSSFYQAMQVDRNRAWLPKIEGYLNDSGKRYLVIVGAAHLLGDDGVIAMLRAKGYSPVQM
ncbi:MAG: TraB/GumN family protein [bacterium]|nr:TraB/GumN family protein [Candidatus Kapabacteria bacterium]